MIGGENAVVKHLDAIFRTLARAVARLIARQVAQKAGGTSEEGYLHCGPHGAGHFVKMIHTASSTA